MIASLNILTGHVIKRPRAVVVIWTRGFARHLYNNTTHSLYLLYNLLYIVILYCRHVDPATFSKTFNHSSIRLSICKLQKTPVNNFTRRYVECIISCYCVSFFFFFSVRLLAIFITSNRAPSYIFIYLFIFNTCDLDLRLVRAAFLAHLLFVFSELSSSSARAVSTMYIM